MGPDKPLPICEEFENAEDYVESLLNLLTTNGLLHKLCGGVHILDFLTATPDLYSRVLPAEWRSFFRPLDMMSILDLLLRDNLENIGCGRGELENSLPPPSSLVQYIRDVRRHLLLRTPMARQSDHKTTTKPNQQLSRHVAVGMNVKKVHEVGYFAQYIDQLAADVSNARGQDITHLVDFGSGQNYLGRALASEPYGLNVIAVESKHHNVEGAKAFDIHAKLAKRKPVLRNKKAFRMGLNESSDERIMSDALPTPPPESECNQCADPVVEITTEKGKTAVQISAEGQGTVQYIEHRIQDGNLATVISQILDPITAKKQAAGGCFAPAEHSARNLMTISLHSCGNLVHHGLRSMTSNPEVKAVALVGCCYNLITERLVPSTYKLPQLRPQAHPRLEKTAKACDPHGFPMSQRFCDTTSPNGDEDAGIKLNITARMMAVQAPSNWGESDCNDFFTRHFFRALLQRILLDKGVVGPPTESHVGGASVSPAGHTSDTPVVIGSLRKSCYANFVTYVRGALDKLFADPERGDLFRSKLATLTDGEIDDYACRYANRKHDLSIVWSLMAFSAGVVEAAIVVDRWLWLREQNEVDQSWVEAVFNYRLSPRNLVVVGVKK